MMKTVILVNVGTPQSPEPEDVGPYLNEFLMDKNIISIPRPFRDILVKGLIVPKRKFSSSEKYKKVWTEKGSPLLVESEALKIKLQKNLGPEWRVVLGMQVGYPRVSEAIQKALDSSSPIYYCPLYPQYATATTGGALEVLGEQAHFVLDPFYNSTWFIRAMAENIRRVLKPRDHLLLSYHGLPISQLKKKNSFCYTDGCCLNNSGCEKNCYKAQCLKTTELLKKELGLTQVSSAFQSRLGRAQWIEPSTENLTRDLLNQGVKNLVVACPSFVSDCLETLEEIGMELKELYMKNGGESFDLVPCVNDSDLFVHGLAEQLRK
jgi:protoporphyrin/coproporphyrin ferrochelatase